MDPRLLRYYQSELQHVREMGGEFAKEYPKIAQRLGLEGFQCADPYVERLLEGFAFMAARVQLKIDAEFPRFTRRLLEMVYPDYLAPVPSMAVVQLHPDLTVGELAGGFEIPRGSGMRSPLAKGERTAAEYRTGQQTTLWPLELIEAEYFTHARGLAEVDFPRRRDVKAGVRLRFRCTAGLIFEKLALDRLPIYLRGSDELPMHLYEQFLANTVAVVGSSVKARKAWHEVLDPSTVRRVGFSDDEALLPFGPRSFEGYRLLREYFCFPQKFLFVELAGLGKLVRRSKENELELMILFDRVDPYLQNAVGPDNFALFCVPAINLFPKRGDRIHLDSHLHEYHVVPDRTRPADFEIYQVTGAVGHGTSADEDQAFRPFYSSNDLTSEDEQMAYFAIDRVPRALSAKERRSGTRSSYVGSEIYLSLVDGKQAPYAGNLKQLSVGLLCTNRDLPLHLSVGAGRTDFTLESGAPVQQIRCVAGPSTPRPSHAHGETAWRLISHLSLNYLTLIDRDAEEGATGLRDLLALYAEAGDPEVRVQIEGVRSVSSQPVVRRLPIAGPAAFGRGLEVSLTLDEDAFKGTGVFLLGAVLEEFFRRYVSINSFTETVVKTVERGEIVRWPVRTGRRHRL